jgi:hypothetical protein
LPLLERELEEMKQRSVPVIPFVCEFDSNVRLNRASEKLRGHSIFAGTDGFGGRVAGESGAHTNIGRRTSTTDQSRAERNFCGRRVLLSCCKSCFEAKKYRISTPQVRVR